MIKSKRVIYTLLALIGFALIITSSFMIWRVIKVRDRITYLDILVRPPTSFPLIQKWRLDLGNSAHDYPIYQDGLVFMLADYTIVSNLYGIEADTSQIIWQQELYKPGYRRCLTSEYLVFGSWAIVVLKAQTGELLWQKENTNSARATCSQDTIFYSEVPRYSIWAADLATGQDIWKGTEPHKGFSGFIYSPETDQIIADESNVPGYMYIIEASSGLINRSIEMRLYAPEDGNGDRGSMYLIDRNELFISGNVLNVQTGDLIHKEERYGSRLPPTVTSDTMYLPALEDGVVAFDRVNYDVKWLYSSPAPKYGSDSIYTISNVAILDDIGYIIFSDATLRAFDLETGQEIGYWQPSKEDLMDWRVCTYPNPRSDCIESARAGLTISEDTLFVSFGDGKLYAFGK